MTTKRRRFPPRAANSHPIGRSAVKVHDGCEGLVSKRLKLLPTRDQRRASPRLNGAGPPNQNRRRDRNVALP
jgi:hypothetical protein